MIVREAVPHTAAILPKLEQLCASIPELVDTETRRDYFANLCEDDFIDLLQAVAASLRGKDNIQYFDGADVFLEGEQVMDHRDKEPWLRIAWGLAQSFLEDTNLETQRALDYTGLTIGHAVALAHPFKDANGRTSRVVSHMIMRGHEPDKLAGVIESSASTEGTTWEILPLLRGGGKVYENWQPDTVAWHAPNADIDEIMGGLIRNAAEPVKLDALDGLVSNDFRREEIIREVIEWYPELANSAYDESLVSNEGTATLHAYEFIESLTNNTDTANLIFTVRVIGQLRRFVQQRAMRMFLQSVFDRTPLAKTPSLLVEPLNPDAIPEDIAHLAEPDATAPLIDLIRYRHYQVSRYYS